MFRARPKLPVRPKFASATAAIDLLALFVRGRSGTAAADLARGRAASFIVLGGSVESLLEKSGSGFVYRAADAWRVVVWCAERLRVADGRWFQLGGSQAIDRTSGW